MHFFADMQFGCGDNANSRLTISRSSTTTAFIAAAEQGALIVALGDWVLREVCRQITLWRVQGVGGIPIAVNVSPLQLDCGDFGANVENLPTEFQVPPWCPELERTESLLIA